MRQPIDLLMNLDPARQSQGSGEVRGRASQHCNFHSQHRNRFRDISGHRLI